MKKLIFRFFALFLIAHCSLTIDDCSAQWVQMSAGMRTETVIQDFTILVNTIFAATVDSGVYKSTNFGVSWSNTGLNNLNVQCLTVQGNYIFAGTAGNGIYRSSNNGLNWVLTSPNNQIASDIISFSNIIFAGTVYGVFYSTNNGANWTQAISNQDVVSLTASGNNVFAGTANGTGTSGVYLSTNYGSNWIPAGLSENYVFNLAASGNNIFAGTGSNGVYKTTNNGTNWNQTGLNQLGYNIQSVACSGNYVFVGIYRIPPVGIFISTNNGVNWYSKNQGFGFQIPTVKAFLITGNYVFAGTYGQSVWRRNLDEIIEVNQISEIVPSVYSLQQNYPNPFNPTTNIRFQIKDSRFVTLKVFDVLGREVETLISDFLKAGIYETQFPGSHSTNNQITSGIYFYRIEAGDYRETMKMILMK